MPLTESIIDESVGRYIREYDRYAKLAEFIADICRAIADDKLIRATISFRAKDPERLRGKLRKYIQNSEEALSLDSVDKVFNRVGDLAGVRVATYVEKDRLGIVEELTKEFKDGSESIEIESKDKADRLYRATHCQVSLREEQLIGTYFNLRGLTCEIQVCSLLAHVYNEIEHDIRYKQLTGDISEGEGKLLDALGKLTAAGDVLIETTLREQEGRQKERQGKFEDEYDFVVRTRGHFSDVKNFHEHARQLLDELWAFGLDSPEVIKRALLAEDYRSRASTFLTKLEEICKSENSPYIYVHPDSSDQLLMLLLEKYAPQIESRHPAGRGRGKPSRIRSLYITH